MGGVSMITRVLILVNEKGSEGCLMGKNQNTLMLIVDLFFSLFFKLRCYIHRIWGHGCRKAVFYARFHVKLFSSGD